MRRRLAAAVGTAGLVVTLAVGGCASGGEDNATSSNDSAGVAPAQEGGRADADLQEQAPAGAQPGTGQAADPAKPGAGQPGAGVQAPNLSIIYTGSMAVRVEDVGVAASRATSIATGAGGFVGADRRSDDGSSSKAILELRVPAPKFHQVVDELSRLGIKTERRDLNSQDVTEEVIDLDARITTQRARVDSGRRLLAQAKTLSELVSLESELARREADLASLEAKKRRLADLAAMSTVTVELLAPDAVVTKPERDPGFLAGLEGGWTALIAVLQVALLVLGALLPFALVLGLPAYLAYRLARRRRRRPATPLVPPARTAPDETESPERVPAHS